MDGSTRKKENMLPSFGHRQIKQYTPMCEEISANKEGRALCLTLQVKARENWHREMTAAPLIPQKEHNKQAPTLQNGEVLTLCPTLGIKCSPTSLYFSG